MHHSTNTYMWAYEHTKYSVCKNYLAKIVKIHSRTQTATRQIFSLFSYNFFYLSFSAYNQVCDIQFNLCLYMLSPFIYRF